MGAWSAGPAPNRSFLPHFCSARQHLLGWVEKLSASAHRPRQTLWFFMNYPPDVSFASFIRGSLVTRTLYVMSLGTGRKACLEDAKVGNPAPSSQGTQAPARSPCCPGNALSCPGGMQLLVHEDAAPCSHLEEQNLSQPCFLLLERNLQAR